MNPSTYKPVATVTWFLVTTILPSTLSFTVTNLVISKAEPAWTW